MKQSFITDDMEEVTLADLLDGETVYTVPWAMQADGGGALWIAVDFSFQQEPMGTCHMQVRKEGDLYHVSKKSLRDHKFKTGQGPVMLNPTGPLQPVVLTP